jgi:hypothetical protein
MESIMSETRRTFLTSATALPLAARPALSADTPLPTIRVGKYEMTRLTLGSNPMTGASHFNPILDQVMREWMTPERIMEILKRAEQAGIRSWQLHNDPKLMDCIRRYKGEGGKMNCFILSDYKDPAGSAAELAKLGVVGVVHHGERSDVAYRENSMEKIHDFCKAAHDAGVMAGISMHNPSVLDYVEGKGWETDFYMTCVYRRSRTPDEQRKEFVEAVVGEPYFEKDPERMCKMIRQTKKTCFAFKILAAGRNIKTKAAIDQAFKFMFENIKPQDGVIVGMFPRFKDEIVENAALTRRYGMPQRG